MKKFLAENPTIAFGLGLPIVIVAIFLLVSGVPALFVDDPQYDVLYITDYYGYGNGIQITVVNQRVQVTYRGNASGYPVARLWRYSPKTGGVREIGIALPPGLATPAPGIARPEADTQITPITVPELADLTVDPSSIAPDGYKFSSGTNGYSPDFFTGMFASRYQKQAVLTKNGRNIRLPNTDTLYYSNYAHFIGWVIAP